MQLQFFNKNYSFFITWNINENIIIGNIITLKNEKQKINGYKKLLSDLIISSLANNSRYLFEYNEFKQFVDKIQLPYTEHIKVTKKYFNSIPYFNFKIIDFYNDIVVLDPINGNYNKIN